MARDKSKNIDLIKCEYQIPIQISILLALNASDTGYTILYYIMLYYTILVLQKMH